MQLTREDVSEAQGWRRHLHRIPEFGLELPRTAAFVAETLESFGIEVHEVGGGVVGVLRRGSGRRKIGLRADMDALQITEETGLDYISRNPGYMHACGHDGHTAMLLGAARLLAARQDFDATVTFVFQPDEEHGRGARAMIEDGLFERFAIDEIYALHNLPGLPAGTFATRSGPIASAEDNFEIELIGVGGHAAAPHASSEALLAGCHLVTALQAIVSRRINPLDQVVVSATEILTDGTRNVLPGRCTIKGDARSYTIEAQQLIERHLRQLAEGTAAAFGLTARISYTHEFAASVNAAGATEAAYAAATAAGCTVIRDFAPLTGSDDFGLMLQHRPGNYGLLGNGSGSVQLHNPRYDFNDDVLRYGIAYFVSLVTADT